MRAKVKDASTEVALIRVLEALEQELIDASDEEIVKAATELGMDPTMRGSAAFAGIKFPVKPQLSDFFDLEGCKSALAAAAPIAAAAPRRKKRKERLAGRDPQPRRSS